ncbi:hypothetical protein [Jiangella mangrovi]|uniref:Uncharacterized protein n=1 Tax=Jiangella mangrovi TaxID=1524084 RepID=A0A7W9GUL2_9ACTN|nr:hypothetical protein [Jiangella mangrovi]MBB5790383.1 hypothetical protein [Jiangella mangrovi]
MGRRRRARGEAAGTRALIGVLLHRGMTHEHAVAGIATALRAGALTPDAVAVEARKAAEQDAITDDHGAAADAGSSPAPVTSLTQRRLTTPLPADTRPPPSVAAYYQL